MTRLHYWLTAKTQYNIHSPFIFDLYNKVLFAQVKGGGRKEMYHGLIYKFADHFGLKVASSDPTSTTFEASDTFERLLILNRPHGDKDSEARLKALLQSPDYNVSLDLYDAAVLFLRPSMKAQHYLLK